MASCALTIGSPPVWPKSYDRNSDPRNVASDGALSIIRLLPIIPSHMPNRKPQNGFSKCGIKAGQIVVEKEKTENNMINGFYRA